MGRRTVLNGAMTIASSVSLARASVVHSTNSNLRRRLLQLTVADQLVAPQPDPGDSRPLKPETSTGGGGNQGLGGTAFETLDPNVVIILVVLLFALICAAFLNSIMRCVMRRSNRPEIPQEAPVIQGLDSKALATLPILTFRATEKLKDGAVSDCTICLSEFVENDRIRLLPKCNHVFHIDCIDMWLLSHISCPVCRDSIVDDPSIHSIVVDEAGQEQLPTGSTNSSVAVASIRAELLRDRSSSSDSAIAQDATSFHRGRPAFMRSSFYSMFVSENVASLFSLGSGRGGHAASSSSGPTGRQRVESQLPPMRMRA